MKKLGAKKIQEKASELKGWVADDVTQVLQKEFTFKDFSDAMIFANRVGEIAEEENHHPDMCISWGSVVVILTTHDVGGLTQKDFDIAERVERMGK